MTQLSRPFSATLKALLFAALLFFAAACGSDSETTEAASSSDSDADSESDSGAEEAMSDDMDDSSMGDGSMDDSEMAHGDDHGGHGHGAPLEVPDGMAVPAIEVTATTDTKSGHNLFVTVGNFTIAPESASLDPVDGEGHLHLYVDGERQGRFYNTELHLDGLEPGRHEVMVEVSANNHSPYAVDGVPITAMTTIVVEDGDGHDGHGHSADHGGELFESANPPEIALTVTEDPKSGYNLFVAVTNLEFAAENAGGDPVDGQGHLHLVIDGEKAGRLYGPWTHLNLEPGTREIMVEVSGNDHVRYGIDGEPIMAMASVEVAKSDGDHAGDHDHDSHDDDHDDDHDGDHDHDSHGHHGTGETLDMAAAAADVVIEGSLVDGDLLMDDRRIEVAEGQTVGVIFNSDEADEIHVHGYDILADVGPDTTADIAFLADNPGTFEVEIEGNGRFLFEILVR